MNCWFHRKVCGLAVVVFVLPGSLSGVAKDGTGGRGAPVSFRNDVLPILGKAGCNGGSCHAKAGGQNGFELTVFSYDPEKDYREIVEDSRGRRIFPAAPEHSLVLRKATQTIEHEGGQRFKAGSPFHETLRRWIAQGAPFSVPDEPALERISVEPASGQYSKGAVQPLTVSAHYSDGTTRDVTHLCEYQSNDPGMAEVDHDGAVQVGKQSGEGVIVVRYLDKVEVARIAVPPDEKLPESVYEKLPVNNPIDRLAYARHRELGLLVSDPCSDEEFLRRAFLDTIGRLPGVDRARAFLADGDADKRRKLIDEILNDPRWPDYWATKFGDLMRPNTQRVGVKPVFLLDRWIRRRLAENTPYNEFVAEVLTAVGSTHEYGPVVLFRDKRTPADVGEYVSRIFLGVRFDCARCHHHPNEKWGQDDYYQLAAFFGSVKRKGRGVSPPISGDQEYIYFSPGGSVKHPVTSETMKPRPPDGPFIEIENEIDPRRLLVDWMMEPENPFFARAIVNRIWGEFFGRGIVHPVDDFRASNPPVNEPLLDWLAADFVEHGYDLKHLMRRILDSHLYQISSLPNESNVTDQLHFSRAYRRRLPAEVALDAVSDVTGTPERFEGLPKAAPAMLTWNTKMRSVFMDTFGRPDSSADSPCERDPSPTIVQALHLMNSERLQEKIASGDGRARRLAESDASPEQIIDEIYLAAFSRFPTADEKRIAGALFEGPEADRMRATEDLTWALINSAEFVFNH